jgi:hypothetical protein
VQQPDRGAERGGGEGHEDSGLYELERPEPAGQLVAEAVAFMPSTQSPMRPVGCGTELMPMRTIGSPALVRSLFRLGLLDRIRVMVFPTIHGATGAGPVFAELPDVRLSLIGTTVIDGRLVLLDYIVGD